MDLPDLEPDDAPVIVLTRRAKRRLLGTGLTLLALLAVPYAVPGLDDARPWRPNGSYVPFWNITARSSSDQGEEQKQEDQLADFEQLAIGSEAVEPEAVDSDAVDDAALEPSPAVPALPRATDVPAVLAPPSHVPVADLVFPAYAGHADDEQKVTIGIEGAESLAHYFGQLTLTDLKLPGAITRAGQWGDSVLGGDGLTHALRQRLQARFGDAGHGFHALSRYSIGYGHHGVRFQDRGGWRSCEIIFKCRPDQRYGYGGISSGSSAGGTSVWQTTKEGPGSRVSRFELWYAKSPDGGRFQVKIDGEAAPLIETRAKQPSDAVQVFPVPDGPHSFEVRAAGGGASRGYGVVLERDVPGVVWDELSLIGSFTQRLDYQDPRHLGWQLQRRDIDLMVFIFGGNDVQREYDDLKTDMLPYENEYSRVIAKFRAGRPEASCLVMSLIDHGARAEDGVRTRSIVPRLVSSQRKVALAQGCAFFDTFHAMGGENSIGRWYRARPQLAAPDFSHPTPAGQSVIATLFYRALMLEYAAFRRRHVGEALPPLLAQAQSDETRAAAVEASGDAP
jgi:lysophospholipase L1-like esterase